MKRLLPWILALAALAAVTNLSGAWTSVQEPKPRGGKLGGMEQIKKNRAARHAALKAVLPTMKTRLAEAITLAEKETGGTAYSAGVEILEGKGSLQVNLFTNEKFTVVNVDPETKKVTVVTKKAEEEEDLGGEAGGDDAGGDKDE